MEKIVIVKTETEQNILKMNRKWKEPLHSSQCKNLRSVLKECGAR